MKAPSAATVKRAAKYSGRAVTGVISLIFRVIGTIILIALLTGMLFACFFTMYIKNSLSDELNVSLSDFSLNQTSVIYYKDSDSGQWTELETLYSGDNSVWVPYNELPKYLEYAAVAIEDHRFYEHHGVDWYRTGGAVFKMFVSFNTSFGGSSITQQLIKNLTWENEVTVQRKITEIFRALDFERRYTKEEIMEAYLNRIPLGESCQGVGAAALVYFNKDVSELSIAECASLIGITNNPSKYDPYISEKTRENNKTRQETILGEMLRYGYITEQQYDEAMAETLVFQRAHREETQADPNAKTHYWSWFTDAVVNDVISDLAVAKNITESAASDLLFTGGYKIYTTMDPKIQAAVDEIYNDTSNLPENLSTKQPLQSAIIIMDPYTGDIVGMAGGVGEKIGNRLYNRATDMKRPPGSSIKPIAVYAPAMDLGYIYPWTIVNDSATGTLVGRSDGWWPKNSDRTNRGLVTIETAVQNSINTIAAQVLDKLTPQVSYNFLKDKLHITSLVLERDGLTDIAYAPLGLGQLTDGISLREAAAAYTIFPNKGIYTEGRTYSKVLDSNNNVIIDNVPEQTVAIGEETAYWMTELMRKVVTNGTGSAARLKDVTGIPLAGKTGTSSGSSDRWFTGFTPYYVASCWSGYEYPETIPGSNNPATVMFSKVMSLIHSELEPRDFYTPQDMKQVTVCSDTGLLATDACAHDIRGNHTMTVMMPSTAVPKTYCQAHVWQDFCKIQVETLWGDGTKVAVPGTITGAFTDSCPPEDRVTASIIDPSKLTQSNVSFPDLGYPYLVGNMYDCYVHPYLYVPPAAEETPNVYDPSDPNQTIPWWIDPNDSAGYGDDDGSIFPDPVEIPESTPPPNWE